MSVKGVGQNPCPLRKCFFFVVGKKFCFVFVQKEEKNYTFAHKSYQGEGVRVKSLAICLTYGLFFIKDIFVVLQKKCT